MASSFNKDIQYYRFCLYGFFKNLRFFEAFLILYFLEQGLSFLAIGTLYAIREITINIFEIPSGIIADAFGRRRTMIFAFVFYIISFIVFFTAESYIWFMLAMIIFSLGEACRSGNHKAMIFQYLSLNGWEDQKVRYYGNTRSWSQMGSAFSALSGAAIVFFTGSYKYIFLFSVIPYVLNLIMVATYPRLLDGNMQKFEWSMIRENFKEVFRSLIKALKSGKVMKIIGSLSVYSGYYKAVKDYLQTIIAAWALAIPLMFNLNEEEKSSLLVGLVFFIVYMLSSFASRSSGWFSERYAHLAVPLNYTLLAGFAFGLISGIFYFYEFWVFSVIFFIAIYMIENIRKPIGVSYLGSNVNENVLASVLSVDSQLKSLIAAVLAPVFGIFADLYGVGWSLMIVSTALLLLAPLISLKTGKRIKYG